jgi:hypothetical protein
MEISSKELWTVVHGLILGTIFLLAFGGGMAGLWSLRPELVTPAGVRERMRRLVIGTWAMAITAWLTVIIGTYVVYPWYRAKPPKEVAGAALVDYPRSYLLSKPSTKGWHEFGMEWKEHVAWFAPILATVVAFVVTRRREQIVNERQLRRALLLLFSLAFYAAAVAGVFGAFINKAAATR